VPLLVTPPMKLVALAISTARPVVPVATIAPPRWQPGFCRRRHPRR
jgi:hypothetical protein